MARGAADRARNEAGRGVRNRSTYGAVGRFARHNGGFVESGQIAAAPAGSRLRSWIGVMLLLGGLLGHLLAAQAIGGYYGAYRDHIAGFTGFALLTGFVVALLGRRFWRGRTDITLLTIGVVQAIFGCIVYLLRFHIA